MKKATFILFLFTALFFLFFLSKPAMASGTLLKTDIKLAVDGKVIKPERDLLVTEGRLMAPVRTVFEKAGAKVIWYEDINTVQIIKNGVIVSMEINSNTAYVNAKYTPTDIPPLLIQGTVMVPVNFVAKHLNVPVNWDEKSRTVNLGNITSNHGTSTATSTARGGNSRHIVVIDAGHGGKDPGAKANGLVEKDLNLDIALRLEKLLKEEGITTYMTRNSDWYPDLYSRAALANQKGADLFISIHHNAGHSKYNGTMALYYPTRKSGFTGKDFAVLVEKELVRQLGTKSLGVVARPNLVVLRKTKMPAVIAEIGYLTNNKEAGRIADSSFRQKAAEALKTAVLKAFRQIS